MTERPDPPAGLLKAARDRWEAWWTSPAAGDVDLSSDLPRLIRWIEQTDEYDRVAAVVRKTRLVKGSQGQPVANPLIGYLGQLEGQITRAETDFGMSPLARHRLKAPAEAVPAEPAATKVVSGVANLTARIAARKATAQG